MSILLDSHYHLDFIQDHSALKEFLQVLKNSGIQIVAQTLLPSSFMALYQQVETYFGTDLRLPLLSLGFHPWWIESENQMEEELSYFIQALRYTNYIGEIGLDFSPFRLQEVCQDLQILVLERILEVVCQRRQSHTNNPPYVLSLHCVQSASTLIDLIENYDLINQKIFPILHGFSGTSDELTRHIRLGGYLSVSKRMLTTKKGRAYVQQIPGDRILLESDLPSKASQDFDGVDYFQELEADIRELVNHLSDLRQEDMDSLLIKNQEKIFGSLV